MQTPAVEPGFTPLFNGKDFTGWKLSNAPSFTIENGAIVAKAVGMQGHAFYDGPFMDHSFRNFELKVDVMTRQNSNGGIFILTEFVEKGWPSKGFEIQVNNSYMKDPRKTGSLYNISDIMETPAKDDEWFTEHIIVQGDTITIKVNDKQVVQWTLPKEGSPDFGKRTITPGTVALQAHDPNSTVYYKNIRHQAAEVDRTAQVDRRQHGSGRCSRPSCTIGAVARLLVTLVVAVDSPRPRSSRRRRAAATRPAPTTSWPTGRRTPVGRASGSARPAASSPRRLTASSSFSAAACRSSTTIRSALRRASRRRATPPTTACHARIPASIPAGTTSSTSSTATARWSIPGSSTTSASSGRTKSSSTPTIQRSTCGSSTMGRSRSSS